MVKKIMPTLSAGVIVEFCKLCGWAYESWLNHRELFDNNPRKAELQKSRGAYTIARLSIISQEYTLLQIIKLHDPPFTGGQENLSVEYVVTHGIWAEPIHQKLEDLSEKLKIFASQLTVARNKLLSHHDLNTIVAGGTLGSFSQGEDEKYFADLQEFVNIVHQQIAGKDWPFNVLVKSDVSEFLAMIFSGTESR